jgi:L-alanine-DL-glutamate epimerase-like enolase superfamily enzyme
MFKLGRRNFLKGLAAIPAVATLSNFSAMAAPNSKKIKITDVKMMTFGSGPRNMVKIETDSGIAGIGEAYWGRGVKDVVLGYLRPLVIGEDPLGIEFLYSKMLRSTGGAGSQAGVTVTAITGVEIALWDLAGKILGVPVYKLLGGKFRDGVRAYWTLDPTNILDPASCREFAAYVKNSRLGITAVKTNADNFALKYDPQFKESGHEPNSRHLTNKDLDRIAQGFQNEREAVGPDIDIAAHCHWEYDLIDALELARAVQPIRPMWLEDPMPPDYSESWVKLTAASPVPILTGENLYRVKGFQPFIQNNAIHLVQIDIPKSGGLLESKKIADLAELYDIPVCAHTASSPLGAIAAAHCAASMRDFRAMEFSIGPTPPQDVDGWEKFVIYDGPVIKDGKYQVQDKPGFGVELNEDVVRANLPAGEAWWG